MQGGIRIKNNRIIFFDILRIIAIFLVVFGHLMQAVGFPYLCRFYGITNFYWVTIAGLGVTIFLIVSGCVLAYNYKELLSIKELKQFYINRFLRLYPAYWIAIIITILFFLVIIPGYASTLSPENLILTFSGLYVFLDQWGGPIMNVGWFIGLILSLYLLYPIINYLFNKNKNFTLLLLLAVSVVSRVLCGQLQSMGIGDRLIDWVPTCRVFEFGLGIFMVKASLYPKTVKVPGNLVASIIFLSNISFPLYLIHYSFLDGQIFNAIKSSPLYYPIMYYPVVIVAFIILSLIIYYIDNYIQGVLRHKTILSKKAVG